MEQTGAKSGKIMISQQDAGAPLPAAPPAFSIEAPAAAAGPGRLSSAFGSLGRGQAGRFSGGSAVKVNCPHCGALAKSRTSKVITPLFKELRFQCSNVDGDDFCGHTFVASLVIERTVVQSARPNPRIRLPISAPRTRRDYNGRPLPANDVGPA